MVKKLGPKTGSRVKVGQRVVAVPWPTAGGDGTYQQYVAVPEKDLVSLHIHLQLQHFSHACRYSWFPMTRLLRTSCRF